MRTVPRLCGFYPGICRITEEKARIKLSRGKKNVSQGKKTSEYRTHTHITKPTQIHKLQNPHIHIHTHITKQYKTTTVQIKTNTVQDIPK